MKMSGHQKLKVLGTDQNIVQEIDHSCREEKKRSTKHKEIDKDPMMATQEREGEKEKSGKKSKKKHEENVKGKETKSNVMVDDHDKSQVEKKDKKRTREKEKRDDVFNGCEGEREMKKRKKDDMMVYDKETMEKNQKEEEGDKEEQKEKMGAMEAENAKEAKKRREKKTPADNEEKKKGKKSKIEKGDGVLNGYEDDREMKEKDDMESNNEEKKRKEKKILYDDEEKKKKKSKKERKDDVSKDDREMKEKKDDMESNNEEEKEKKRKDKKTQDVNEEKKKEKKSKKEKTDDVSNDCDDREMKEKDNIEPNNEKKKKEKKGKKSKKVKKDDVLNGCEDEREVKTGQKDDMKANNKAKKTKKTKKTQDAMIADDEERKKKGKKVRFSDEVEVYPLADSSSKSKETEEIGLVRGKRFTKEEDELIKKAVSDYIESHHLGEEGLDMVMHCISHAKIRNCWREIGTALPWRPYVSVYIRAHILFERGDSKWTPEELQLVREAHAKYGNKWKLIAQELGKFRVHVKDAWRRIKLNDMKKGHWSQDEYQQLFELVNKDLQMKLYEEKKSKHGMLRDNISWEAISDTLGTRTNSDCCMKWYNQLTSPMIAQGKWSDVDDYRLLMELVDLDASCEDEVDWENLLEHRSADVTHTRWQQMVRHLGVHGTKSFSEMVEVLSQRYCPDLLQVRETLDSKPIVD